MQSTVAISKSEFRLRDGLVVIVGCLMFVFGRKMIWGHEESLASVSLWLMAITPFLVYHAAANYSRTKDFAVKTDFIQIWLASLAAFILLRGSGNSSGYEAQFYNSTEPGLLRYAELSAIYAVMGYLFVTLWRLPDMPNVKTAAGMIASRTFSLLASFLLFTFSLFIIET